MLSWVLRFPALTKFDDQQHLSDRDVAVDGYKHHSSSASIRIAWTIKGVMGSLASPVTGFLRLTPLSTKLSNLELASQWICEALTDMEVANCG